MENAAEALKMAGAVLLFVLALSVAIVSFGQARETADTILDYRDRVRRTSLYIKFKWLKNNRQIYNRFRNNQNR